MHTRKVRAALGAGFAVLLGLGVAAVLQTFVWQADVSRVDGTYEFLTRLESLAFAANSSQEATVRLVDPSARDSVGKTHSLLDSMHLRAETLGAPPDELTATEGPSLRQDRLRLVALIDREYTALDPAVRSPEGESNAFAAFVESGDRDRVLASLESLRNNARTLLDRRVETRSRSAVRARVLFLSSGIICCALIVIAGWRFSEDLDRREGAVAARAAFDSTFRELVEAASDFVIRLDAEGRFEYCNPAALQFLRYSQDEVIGRSWSKLVRLDQRRSTERFYFRQVGAKRPDSYHEFAIVDGYGRARWIGLNVHLVTKPDGAVAGFQAVGRDITERRRTESEVERRADFLTSVTESIPGRVYVFDLAERTILYASRSFTGMLGHPDEPSEDFDRQAARFLHGDDIPALRAHHESMQRAARGEVHRIEYRVRHADGNWLWFTARETPFAFGPDGRVRQVIGVMQDVTAARSERAKLIWQARFDPLTRLANRHHFVTQLQALLRKASLAHVGVVYCRLDVDSFREIVQRHGRAAGDEIVESVGKIVQGSLRPEDAGSRLGDAEFCFVLYDTTGDKAARVADRIRERLAALAFGVGAGKPAYSISTVFASAEWRPEMGAKDLMEAGDRALSDPSGHLPKLVRTAA